MPMGNGRLFLPVKADIRKKFGKKVGDWINVVLFADNAPTEIPEELLLLLKDNPTVFKTLVSYSDGQKKIYCLDLTYYVLCRTKYVCIHNAVTKVNLSQPQC
jgi:hypothetical protein